MKSLEGFIDDGRGEPLAGIPAVVTRLTDGVTVLSGVTDADGHWSFTSLPVADEYVVTLSDSSGNAVSRAPWSGELRSAWVRDRLDVAGLPVVVDPAAGNSLLWTATGLYAPTGITLAAADLRYEPLDSAYTKAEADARYPQKTDIDPYPTYLTSTEGNATYLPLTGGALSGPLTIQSKAVGVSATGGNTLSWNSDGFYVAAGAVTDIWVNTTGDTMTGDLNMTANVLPTVTNVRSLGSTSLRWLKVWATDADFTNAPTVGGAALLTSTTADALFLTPAEGNAAYATAAHNHDATYVQLTGGSVMTGLLGPTTTNTRDLGTTALRWRKLWAVDGEFTNAPTVGGVAVLTATSAGLLYEPIDTMYTKAESDARYEPIDTMYTKAEDDARFVNLAGGSVMTGLLGPTTNNTRDLGTTALRWRKLWAVDGEFTNVPTVGGVALPTAAHTHDAAYVNVTGDTMSGTLNITGSLLATATVNAGTLLSTDGNLSVTNGAAISNGLVVASGNATIDTGNLIVTTGNATIAGTLSVKSRPVAMAGCRVRKAAVQTLTTGVAAAIAFDNERYDTDNFHDNVTNNTRLTVPAGLAGKYVITGCVEFVGHATGNRAVSIRVSGALVSASVQPAVNTNAPAITATAIWDMAVGDYAELWAYQDSGGNLNVSVGANYTPELSMQRIG